MKIPFSILRKKNQLFITWVEKGTKRLNRPFFAQNFNTRDLAKSHETNIGALSETSTLGTTPSGFIFHCGRSRSTLLCQQLSCMKKNFIVPEAPVISNFLHHSRDLPRAQRICLLRGVLLSLCNCRSPHQNKVFFKFYSGDLMHLDLILEAFPKVPWIFISRKPAEILSALIMRRPAPTPFGKKLHPSSAREFVESHIRKIKNELNTLCKNINDHALMVSYEDLLKGLPSYLRKHFDIQPSTIELKQIRSIMKYHSKSKNKKIPYSEHKEVRTKFNLDISEFKGSKQLNHLYQHLGLT